MDKTTTAGETGKPTKSQIMAAQLKQYQALSLNGVIRLSEMRVHEAMEHFEGQMYIALSGGKDSMCMADIVWKLYPNVPAVFADTGNELDSVRKVIDDLVAAGRPVTIVKPKMTFDEVVKKYGYPVISKKMSDYINRCRRTKNPEVLRRHLIGQKADGSPSPMSKIPEKWQHLLNADFNVTNKCCGILKCDPTSEYAKETGRFAFVGTMAEESFARLNSYINHGGCNAFDQKDPCSRPIMFWTEQHILQYTLDAKIPLATAYGEIVRDINGNLNTTGDSRTGCKFCLFGVHLEKGENRIQRLAKVEPESYKHCIEDLNYSHVMDEIGAEWRVD